MIVDKFALSVVTNGYRIPLSNKPNTEIVIDSMSTQFSTKMILQNGIQALLDKGAIQIV